MNISPMAVVEMLAGAMLYVVEVHEDEHTGLAFRLTDGTHRFLPAEDEEMLGVMSHALSDSLVGNADFVLINNAIINITHLKEVAPHAGTEGNALIRFTFHDDINFALTYRTGAHATEDIKKFNDAWQLSILVKQRENEHRMKPTTH